MKRIISLIALTLVFGCGEKQSPESKKDIAIFTSQDVKAYILVLSPDLDLEKMVSTFPPLFDKWESIKQTHTLPHKEAQRVSDALNLHKLFLLYYEVSIVDHQSMSGQESRDAYKKYSNARNQIISEISESYWKHLDSKINENAKSALNTLRTSTSIDALEDNSIGSVDLIIGNFQEMISALTTMAI